MMWLAVVIAWTATGFFLLAEFARNMASAPSNFPSKSIPFFVCLVVALFLTAAATWQSLSGWWQ